MTSAEAQLRALAERVRIASADAPDLYDLLTETAAALHCLADIAGGDASARPLKTIAACGQNLRTFAFRRRMSPGA